MTTTDATDLPTRGSGVTEGEPTPAPHSVGVDPEGGRGGKLTRASALARAKWSLPEAPSLQLRALFARDEASPSPLRETFPRCNERINWALRGAWTDLPEVDEKGVTHYSNKRLLYLGATVLIACPIAAAIDLIDWATFPLGHLAITAIVLIILFISV